jgi:hypothetical protein
LVPRPLAARLCRLAQPRWPVHVHQHRCTTSRKGEQTDSISALHPN